QEADALRREERGQKQHADADGDEPSRPKIGSAQEDRSNERAPGVQMKLRREGAEHSREIPVPQADCRQPEAREKDRLDQLEEADQAEQTPSSHGRDRALPLAKSRGDLTGSSTMPSGFGSQGRGACWSAETPAVCQLRESSRGRGLCPARARGPGS